MASFVGRIAGFCLPIALLLSFPLYVFVRTGEHVGPLEIVERTIERDGDFRFGAAYSDHTEPYKLAAVVSIVPDVLVLGNSRVLQFRSAFFRDEDRFYNAGRGVRRLRHFRTFLDHIPRGKEPKVMILGLDQSFFNGNWDTQNDYGYTAMLGAQASPIKTFFAKWWVLYRDYYAGKFDLDDVHRTGDVDLIGLQARVKRRGFRADGSWDFGDLRLHGQEVDDGYEQDFRRTRAWIARDENRMRHGREVSGEALAELRRLLEGAASRGIAVVGYLPPYPNAVHRVLRSMREEYGYVQKLPEAAGTIFREYGYDLMDFSDLATLGASDRETIDGIHESEKATLRLLLAMASASPVLEPYCDVQFLERTLRDARRDDYLVDVAGRDVPHAAR